MLQRKDPGRAADVLSLIQSRLPRAEPLAETEMQAARHGSEEPSASPSRFPPEGDACSPDLTASLGPRRAFEATSARQHADVPLAGSTDTLEPAATAPSRPGAVRAASRQRGRSGRTRTILSTRAWGARD